MAQLKDTTVSGSLRATDTIYSTTIQAQILKAPTASNGTTYGPGTNGQVLKSNGTSVYWGTDSNSVTGVKGNSESSYRTGNVNITASNIGLGNVENTKLSTWTGSANISTVGTITSGTWNGTAISSAYIGSHTHSYAGSSSAGGAATNAVTSADTSNTLYPVGVTSAADTTLKRDTSITMVGGTITATTFSGNLSGNATSANYINLYETRGTTTTLNKTANYVTAGAMFHLVASSSTSSTDNGKTPTDANILQMNWDNNGGYDSQLGIATSPNRMFFRSRVSQKTAWEEVAHAPVSANSTGNSTQPVYMASDGTLTACTSYANASVASAAILTTARTLWGQSFDGSANVSGDITMPTNSTLTIGSGTLTATNYSGNAATATKWYAAQKVYVALGTASKTETIQGGNSNAEIIGVDGTLAETNGGTGQNTYTKGQILYASAANTLSKLDIGTAGYTLQATANGPAWTQKVAVANGGTNATTVTKYGIAYGNSGADAYAFTSAGTDGYILIGKGTSAAPEWQEILPISHGGTGTKTAPTQYGVIYASSSTAYASTAAGTANRVFIAAGNSAAPKWTANATLSSEVSTAANTAAYDILTLGNNANVSTTTAHSEGKIVLYSAATAAHTIVGASTTSAYTHTLPNNTGTLVSLSGGTAKGSETKPIYIPNTGIVTECNTYAGGTAVTLNGTSCTASTASFYAPTSSGTANYILASGGANTSPTWITTASGALYATAANGAAQFGTLPVAQGGTNATSVTKFGIAYGNSSANGYTFTSAGSDGYILIGKGSSTAPTWQQTLPVGHGGTGVTSHTANRLVWSTSADAIQATDAHYVSATQMSIASNTAPDNDYVLKVNGNSQHIGAINIKSGGIVNSIYSQTGNGNIGRIYQWFRSSGNTNGNISHSQWVFQEWSYNSTTPSNNPLSYYEQYLLPDCDANLSANKDYNIITEKNLTDITKVGTITTGTWNASTLGIAYGGTGATTASRGFEGLTCQGVVPSTVTSLDDIKAAGYYWVNSSNTPNGWPPGMESGTQYGLLEVVGSNAYVANVSNGILIQRLSLYSSSTFVSRLWANGTWYDWNYNISSRCNSNLARTIKSDLYVGADARASIVKLTRADKAVGFEIYEDFGRALTSTDYSVSNNLCGFLVHSYSTSNPELSPVPCNLSSYSENYYFPPATPNLTASVAYYILTTKQYPSAISGRAVPSGATFDTMTTAGVYNIANNCSGYPTTSGTNYNYGILLVATTASPNGSQSNMFQLYLGGSTNASYYKLWIRSRYNQSWKAWKQVTLT